MSMKLYEIKKNCFYYSSYALCVSDTLENHGNETLYGEIYILFRDNNGKFQIFPKEITIEGFVDPNFQVKIDEDFIMTEALNQAKNEYAIITHTMNEDISAKYWWPISPEVSDIVLEKELASLWVTGLAKTELNIIGNTTKYHKLKSFINTLRQYHVSVVCQTLDISARSV